jgi:hypothetical protein
VTKIMPYTDPERERQAQREAYGRRLAKQRGYDRLREVAALVVVDPSPQVIKRLEQTIKETAVKLEA